MKNKLLPVLGALILGALGSGLWELIKPIFLWASSASLNIVTLGLDSLRDGLYTEAASQSIARTSGLTLSLIVSSMAGVYIAFVLPLWGVGRKKTNFPAIADDADEDQLAEYALQLDLIGAEIRIKRLWLSIVVSLSISFVYFIAQRAIYIDRAQSHVNHLCIIVAPFIEQNELAKMRSAFALVESRDDYLKVLSDLERAAHEHGVKTPKFSVF